MQQPPGQGWPPQMQQQNGYGQPTARYGQQPPSYPQQPQQMKNISSQEQDVSSLLDFMLQDINGQKYTETIDPDAGATIDGKIDPGSQLQGSIVYKVPASMKNFTLAFQNR